MKKYSPKRLLLLLSLIPIFMLLVMAASEWRARLGKTDSSSELFDNRVPPTNPGFVVPESSTIAAIAIPIATLMGYGVIKRKNKAI